jgi:hypothetical protein
VALGGGEQRDGSGEGHEGAVAEGRIRRVMCSLTGVLARIGSDRWIEVIPDQRFRWSGGIWWARQGLNLRPPPCQLYGRLVGHHECSLSTGTSRAIQGDQAATDRHGFSQSAPLVHEHPRTRMPTVCR